MMFNPTCEENSMIHPERPLRPSALSELPWSISSPLQIPSQRWRPEHRNHGPASAAEGVDPLQPELLRESVRQARHPARHRLALESGRGNQTENNPSTRKP